MLRKHALFFVACVAAIAWSVESQNVEIAGIIKIREPCKRDHQCIKNAFCKSQQFCICETYYSPSLDLAACHVTVGAPCGDKYNEGCETMSNAECRQNICVCRDNFMIDVNNSSNCIIRPRAPGDVCYHTEECRDSMELAYCVENKCRCYADHHFVNETGSCLRKRGLYQPCKRNYECFIDEKHPDEMECKDGQCACREGEPSCSKGTVSHQPILLALAMTIFCPIHRTRL